MRRYVFVWLLVAGFAGTSAQAQIPDVASSGAYYRFAESADNTMEIKVWGAVTNPGFYEVREGLNLSTVLSLAGGPKAAVRVRSTSSTFRVQLYRLRQDRYQLFTETIMENEITTLSQDPVLTSGDLILTEEQARQRFGWRDGVSLLSTLGTLVLLIDQVFLE